MIYRNLVSKISTIPICGAGQIAGGRVPHVFGLIPYPAIAHAAVYLASDEAAFVHGTVIDVDGGRLGVAVIATGSDDWPDR